MEVYVTEEQQVEAITKWFKKYGNMLSWIIIVIAFVISAFIYWRHHQEVLRDAASDQYLAMLEGLEKNDKDTINAKAQTLLKDYSHSPYASLASFVLAKQAVTENHLVDAQKNLKWIIENSKQTNFQAIARIRLVQLLIAENKLDEALSFCTEKNMGPYLTLIAELKGDIQLKQKEVDAAKKSYELALGAAPEEGMHGPLLKMKMQELGMDVNPKEEKEDKAATS